MKFHIQSDLCDGIVILDPAVLEEMDERFLDAFNIYLDPDGTSELIYDFPEEEWRTVYERETAPVREFLEQGKMWIKLLGETDEEYEIIESEDAAMDPLTIRSGKADVVMASELLQFLYYPDLEMERLAELTPDPGNYRIGNPKDGVIVYKKVG